ncbi:hypothetical protein ABEB36_004754 [Hypothenemus hampei]|uniref:Uncharacterized protein n=1 Tax=Hypothenemus hampei TaxID=57062 RepID=A0ABD1EVR1_HYPHA
MASNTVAGKVRNWTVDEEENLSDHRSILFQRIEWTGFGSNYRETMAKEEITVEIVGQAIKEAMDATFHKKGLKGKREASAYWWNSKIAEIRKEAIAMRRKITRLRKKGDRLVEVEEIEKERKECRKRLRKEIMKSKGRGMAKCLG